MTKMQTPSRSTHLASSKRSAHRQDHGWCAWTTHGLSSDAVHAIGHMKATGPKQTACRLLPVQVPAKMVTEMFFSFFFLLAFCLCFAPWAGPTWMFWIFFVSNSLVGCYSWSMPILWGRGTWEELMSSSIFYLSLKLETSYGFCMWGRKTFLPAVLDLPKVAFSAVFFSWLLMFCWCWPTWTPKYSGELCEKSLLLFFPNSSASFSFWSGIRFWSSNLLRSLPASPKSWSWWLSLSVLWTYFSSFFIVALFLLSSLAASFLWRSLSFSLYFSSFSRFLISALVNFFGGYSWLSSCWESLLRAIVSKLAFLSVSLALFDVLWLWFLTRRRSISPKLAMLLRPSIESLLLSLSSSIGLNGKSLIWSIWF